MLSLCPGLWRRVVVLQVMSSKRFNTDSISSSSCFESNLNGEYFPSPEDNGYYRGIIWELWLGDYSLKSAKMMVRPSNWRESREGGP